VQTAPFTTLFLSYVRRRHTTRDVNHRGLSVGCVNACSVSNKSATLCRAITDERLYVLVMAETWHERADSVVRLDVPDRVVFKLIVTVHRCLNGRAPNYLSNHVIPVSANVSRQRLRSAQQNTLVVPRYRLTTYGRRAFSVAGPTAWNSLPVAFRDPTISDACFRRHLKTILFAQQRRHYSV